MTDKDKIKLLHEVVFSLSRAYVGDYLRESGYTKNDISKIDTKKMILLIVESHAIASARVDMTMHQMNVPNSIRSGYLQQFLSELSPTGDNYAQLYEEIYADYASSMASNDNLFTVSADHDSRVNLILEEGKLYLNPPLLLDGSWENLPRGLLFMTLIKHSGLCHSCGKK